MFRYTGVQIQTVLYPEQIFFAAATFLLLVSAEKCLLNRPLQVFFFSKSDCKHGEVLPIIPHYSSHYFCAVATRLSAVSSAYPHRFVEKRPLTSTVEAEDQYSAAASHGGSVQEPLKAF